MKYPITLGAMFCAAVTVTMRYFLDILAPLPPLGVVVTFWIIFVLALTRK